MTLPRDDNGFDRLDPETRARRQFGLESPRTKPVEMLDAGNPNVWFWFDGGEGRPSPTLHQGYLRLEAP